jgi:hypothetical protein
MSKTDANRFSDLYRLLNVEGAAVLEVCQLELSKFLFASNGGTIDLSALESLPSREKKILRSFESFNGLDARIGQGFQLSDHRTKLSIELSDLSTSRERSLASAFTGLAPANNTFQTDEFSGQGCDGEPWIRRLQAKGALEIFSDDDSVQQSRR